MKNFSIIRDDKEYWISRSIAVCGFIFTIDDGFRVLAVKRGIGCSDEAGKWCCPCGYLDYNETLEDAIVRETFEETNLSLDRSTLRRDGIDDSPSSNRQNVTIRYYSFSNKYASQTITNISSEENEIEDVKWILITDLDKYDWAFNHKERILDCIWNSLDLYGKLDPIERSAFRKYINDNEV